MSTYVNTCPRCKANKMTFEILSFIYIGETNGWCSNYELFCECRNCLLPTIFKVRQKSSSDDKLFRDGGLFRAGVSINQYVYGSGYVSLKDESGVACPEHTPQHLKDVFDEASSCYAIGCYNAATAMFRLCLDLDTKTIADEHDIKGLLYARLQKLIEGKHLPFELEELSHCIRENGNDGAHDGTINKDEGTDIMDFTVSYLESRYTMPMRIKLRRDARNERKQNNA